MSTAAQTSTAPHRHDLRPFRHSHAFGEGGTRASQQALRWVALITLVTMVGELVGGWLTGSLALLADGWHMGTHAVALGGAVLAMGWSRRAQAHAGFAFGGWKIEVLAAYTNALLLGAVALSLVLESVQTLLKPHPIAYGEAITVTAVGLVVNLVSVWLLARAGQAHHHGHGSGHGHDHGHDHNFGAAYLHVLADALTSVLALLALGCGLMLGWRWADPAVALLGAALIGQWSWGLLRQAARALVDATAEPALRESVRQALESDGDARLADLHVWQVGPQAWSAVVCIVADDPLAPDLYRQRLAALAQIRHVTVEVQRCRAAAPGDHDHGHGLEAAHPHSHPHPHPHEHPHPHRHDHGRHSHSHP